MNKRYPLLSIAMLLGLIAAWAQGPNNTGNYYENASGMKGQELKTALYKIIKTPNVTSYAGLWTAYQTTDKRSDGFLRDWYSSTTRYVIGGNNQGANYSREGDSYNREHSFPKSWFNGGSPMNSDVVHVVPSDGYVNNRRSNYPFGEVGTITYQSNNAYSKLGKAKSDLGYSGTVFEPNDDVKGDFARIYFYMATCYEEQIANWSSDMLNNTKYPAYTDWAIKMLLRWSKLDPVDDVEKARNEACYNIQKNRNPFVDYPGLEDYIWGDLKDEVFVYDTYESSETPTVNTPQFNPGSRIFEDQISVSISCTDADAVIYYTTDGSDPTNTSTRTKYTGPLTITETTTVKAVAIIGETTSHIASATYTKYEAPVYTDDQFVKVTNANELSEGDIIAIVNEAALVALSTTQNKNNRGQTEEIQINDEILSLTEDVQQITLEGSTGSWYLNVGNSEYLHCSSDDNNRLLTSKDKNDYSKASITIDSGDASIIFSGGSSNNLRYNKANSLFSCYKTGQQPIQIYKKASSGGRKDPGLKFEPDSITIEQYDEDIVTPVLTNKYNVDVVYSSDNISVANINSTTGEIVIGDPGFANITAYFEGNEEYKEGYAKYTITVTEYLEGAFEKISNYNDIESGKKYLLVYEKNETSGFAFSGVSDNIGNKVEVEISSSVIKALKGAHTVVIEKASDTDNKWYLKDGDYYLAYTTTSTSKDNYLYAVSDKNANGTQWQIEFNNEDKVYIKNLYNSNRTIYYNSSSPRFCCYLESSKQQPITLYKEKSAVEEITVESIGYATIYFSDKNLVVPEGVFAFTYEVSDGALVQTSLYEEGDIITKGTPVVISTLPGTYSFTITKRKGSITPDNMLLGFDETSTTLGPNGETEGYKFYKLTTNKGQNPGFYFGADDGGAFESLGHKAYLAVPNKLAGSAKGYSFNGETDGIIDQAVAPKTSFDPNYYTLSGMKVDRNNLQKGVYIHNGKKIVVR